MSHHRLSNRLGRRVQNDVSSIKQGVILYRNEENCALEKCSTNIWCKMICLKKKTIRYLHGKKKIIYLSYVTSCDGRVKRERKWLNSWSTWHINRKMMIP